MLAEASTTAEERYFIASQRQLVWRKFKRHRLAVISGSVLMFAYLGRLQLRVRGALRPAHAA